MNDRWSTLTAADKVVRLDAGAMLIYPGLAITCGERDRIIGQVWLPQGAEPTFADDERLISQLRAAWVWSTGTTKPPLAWGRGAEASSWFEGV